MCTDRTRGTAAEDPGRGADSERKRSDGIIRERSCHTLHYSSPEALFRAHDSRLVRLLIIASADSDAAADAGQEAFVQL